MLNKYDLEERTLKFAKNIRLFSKKLSQNIQNKSDIDQMIRSSGSIGANYIEANECLGKKDFLMRIKISRKEAKECTYWLKLIDCNYDLRLENERVGLEKECIELMKIFASIYRKLDINN